jgi:hypothetical protein
MSAYSVVGGVPFMNCTSRGRYVGQVNERGSGVQNGYVSGDHERRARFVIMSLHDLHVDAAAYRDAFGSDVEDDFGAQLGRFRREGLIEPSASGYTLTRLGRAWATTMAIEFFSTDVLEKLMRRRVEGDFFVPLTIEEELYIPLFAMFHGDILLSHWSDAGLLKRYVAHLRAQNPAWLRRVARLAWDVGAFRRLPSDPLRAIRTITQLVH